MLSIDFQQNQDNADRNDFIKALTDAIEALQMLKISHVFLRLHWLVVNGWNHPKLQAMMSGSDEDETGIC